MLRSVTITLWSWALRWRIRLAHYWRYRSQAAMYIDLPAPYGPENRAYREAEYRQSVDAGSRVLRVSKGGGQTT